VQAINVSIYTISDSILSIIAIFAKAVGWPPCALAFLADIAKIIPMIFATINTGAIKIIKNFVQISSMQTIAITNDAMALPLLGATGGGAKPLFPPSSSKKLRLLMYIPPIVNILQFYA